MIRMLLAAVFLVFAMPEGVVAFPMDTRPQEASRQWPHQGLFARFDRAALRRGYQVYRKACASCHSLRLLAYRDLAMIGLTMDEAKSIAEKDQVKIIAGGADSAKTRPARLSDHLVAPFPSKQAARAANNGLLPPDLSQIVKAHKNGENVLYSILISNEAQGQLEESGVTYADSTTATGKTMAADVVMFLAWAAEPTLEERKHLGFLWMLFFSVLTVLLFYLNRKIWARLD